MYSLVITLFFLFTGFVGNDIQPDLGTPYRAEVFDGVGDHPTIEGTTSGGHIYVVKEHNENVRVKMVIHKKGKNYASQEANLDDYTIVIQKMGNTIMAVAKHNQGFGMMNWDEQYSIHFVVYTPRSITTTVKTSDGHIGLMGVEGEIDAKTFGGHINGEDMEGILTLKTSGGRVYFRTSGGLVTINE